ncbi:MAG: rane protein [Paenibacillus sp.]|nr:rane protein [Paenibacillus sp.]
MKKGMLVMIALTLLFTFGFGQVADAKRGGFKSPKQSVTQPKNDSASQSNPGTKTGAAAGTAGAATKGGMFGGSSLMKGLMIGGLAGLLFGGMFGSMGAFGEIFGLLINLLAIFAIIMLIRVAFVYLKSKKKNDPDPRKPY